MKLITTDPDAIGGNYVILDHGNGEFSVYAHLKPGSVNAKVGDVVNVGQPIGKLGSSGNSSEPHLHFQVADRPAPMESDGVAYVHSSYVAEGHVESFEPMIEGKSIKLQPAAAPTSSPSTATL